MIVPRNGRYGVRVSIDGKRQWVGTFTTRREARLAEAEALSPTPESEPAEACDRYVDFYLEGYRERTKNSSYETALYKLAAFKEEFAGRPLDSIGPIEAERWARTNRSNVEPVATMFNTAIRKRLIDFNPFKGLDKRGPGRRDMVPYTVPQVDKIATAAGATNGDYGPELEALIRFAFWTGFRAGELFALEWRDIDFDRRRVYVRRRVYGGKVDRPKSGKPQRVLSPAARDAIIGLPRDRDTVFRSKQGRRLADGTVHGYIKEAWGKVGHFTLHELRHACGHHLYVTLGQPARVVAVQLGHRSPRQVEDLYGHGDVGAIEQLDAAMSRSPVAVPDLRDAGEVAESA